MEADGLSLHQYTESTHSILAALLSLSTSAMLVIENSGRILSANEVACKKFNRGQSLNGVNIKGVVAETDYLMNYIKAGKTVRNVALHALGSSTEMTATISPLDKSNTPNPVMVLSLNSAQDKRHTALSALQREASLRSFDKLYGENGNFLSAIKLAKSIEGNENVLIIGESGTGKSSFARAIWAQSGTNKPLVVCNCASLNLLDPIVYLCGEMRGGHMNKGLFEMANGGTLLLEGIEDIPFDLQELFVRPYDNKEIIRDHDFQHVPTDFRIIATASPQVVGMVSKGDTPGGFLPSLYFRLSQCEIHLPACSERLDDLPSLITRIADDYCRLTDRHKVTISNDAMSAMLAYPWPGNIREVEVVISSACDVCRRNSITLQDLPDAMAVGQKVKTQSSAALSATATSISQSKEMQINQIMQMTGNNVGEAAKMLGIGRSTLYKYLKKHS